jgi:hypothetical protein
LRTRNDDTQTTNQDAAIRACHPNDVVLTVNYFTLGVRLILRAMLTSLVVLASSASASDRLSALLAKDPESEAQKAFSSGDRRYIAVPLCDAGVGRFVPGWPNEDLPTLMQPISCADLGSDPKQINLTRAVKYAESYNRKLRQLEGKGIR